MNLRYAICYLQHTITLHSEVTSSDGQAENTEDAVHGLVLPSHCAASIGGIVPEAGAGCLQTGSILLHHDTGNNVLEGFVKLAKLTQALLHYIIGPLVHSAVLVSIRPYDSFYRLFYDCAHFFNNKGSLSQQKQKIAVDFIPNI